MSSVQLSWPLFTERRHQSFPGAEYLLPSDDEESQRLALQHRMFSIVLNDRLICAPVDLDAGDYVLDSGCGSGIWLLDTQRQLPDTVTLFGIDIESGLFPASHPENIHFSVNTMIALPNHWNDKFALVNQRFLSAALTHDHWKASLEESFRVLRPGGWIQLLEFHDIICTPGVATQEYMALLEQIYAMKKMVRDIAIILPTFLREVGFLDIRVEEHRIPIGRWDEELGAMASKDMGSVVRGMKGPVVKAGGFGKFDSAEKYEAWADSVEREWDETPGTTLRAFTTYAQKPTST